MNRAILLFLIVSFSFSCSKDKFDSPGVITGSAFFTTNISSWPAEGYDSHSGIKVTLYDQNKFRKTVETDKNGEYEINNVKEGDYQIRFEKEGFTYYELYDIQHNGTDTLEFFYTGATKTVYLMEIKQIDYKMIKPPFIASYKGSIDSGPNQGKHGENFEIAVEVENAPHFGCIVFVNDSKPVDDLNYELAVHTGTFSRSGIPNPIIRFKFSLLDRDIFHPGSTIYLRYYPCASGLFKYDPWMEIDKYFMIYPNQSTYKEFTLPTDLFYYEGRLL
jgi:hypothetical protein